MTAPAGIFYTPESQQADKDKEAKDLKLVRLQRSGITRMGELSKQKPPPGGNRKTADVKARKDLTQAD